MWEWKWQCRCDSGYSRPAVVLVSVLYVDYDVQTMRHIKEASQSKWRLEESSATLAASGSYASSSLVNLVAS